MNTQQLKDHIKNDIYKGIQTSAAPARMQTDALEYLIDNGLSGSGSGVAIEITDKNDKSSPLWHFGQESTDTVSGIPALGMDILCIDPSVSTIYFNTPSNTKFTCVCPLGDKDFDNGKRLTILGNFTASEKDSLYAVDRYAYSKFRVGFPMPLDGTVDTTQTLTQTVGIDTNNGFVPSAEYHRYVEPIEVVYWNGHWYGKGYDVTLACNEVTDNVNKQYLPVTTGAVCNAINTIKNTYVSNTTRDGDLTSLWTGINAKVASVKIGESGTTITPTNGVITLPPYPTEVSGMITAIGVNSYVDAEGHAIIASPDDSGKATLNVMARDGSNTTTGAFKALADKCSSLGDTALASTYVLPVRSGSDTGSWKLATISNLNTYNDGRYAAKSHNQASSTINVLTGYSKGTSATALSTTDTLNSALSKLENQIDAKANASDVPSIDGLVKTDASNATETTLVELLKKNSTSTPTITDRTLVVLNGTTTATKAYRIKTDDIIKNLPLGSTYAKATSSSAIASTDTVMTALGKLEKALDDKGSGSGTVTQVKVGITAYDPTNGVISLPSYPTVSYPVTSVAGKTGAVTLAKGDVGLGNVGNFKAVSTVASQGLTDTEKSNARANIGAGTSSLTIGTTSSTAAAGNHNHDGTYLKSYTETDPVFKASAAYGITTADITNWNGKGTSNLTIGTTSTTAAAGNHSHSLLHTNLVKTIDNTTTDSGWSMINSTYNGGILMALRTQANAPAWTIGNFSSGICFGGADTKGVLSVAYNEPTIKFAGGNGSKPLWNFGIKGTTGVTYTLPTTSSTLATTAQLSSYAPADHTHSYLPLTGGTLTGQLTGTTAEMNGIAANRSNTQVGGGGLSLYGNSTDGAIRHYGIAFRGTSEGGTHGSVTSDWAVYNYCTSTNSSARGWIWQYNDTATGRKNVASISGGGNLSLGGNISLGGSGTSHPAVIQYNSSTQALEFVFA